MRKQHWWLRGLVALLLLIYLVLAPAPLLAALRERPYYDWLAGERDAQSGVVSLWHVVDFKPYQGSVTAYLEGIAAGYEKEHPGVYVEITGMDAARLRERLERGERPDVWSFSLRQGAPEGLGLLELPPISYTGGLQALEAEGAAVAAPYCCSGYFLLGNAVLLQQRKLVWPTGEPEAALLEQARQADEGDFKAGQAPVFIGDARLAGVVVFGCGGDRDKLKRPLMGGIAERLADYVYVTSDNPRHEDPEQIISEIVAGMSMPQKRTVICDRREAISTAIERHHAGDVIILAGKGHETYQKIGDSVLHFDEREIVAQVLSRL